jgi:hypothetical protein
VHAQSFTRSSRIRNHHVTDTGYGAEQYEKEKNMGTGTALVLDVGYLPAGAINWDATILSCALLGTLLCAGLGILWQRDSGCSIEEPSRPRHAREHLARGIAAPFRA